MYNVNMEIINYSTRSYIERIWRANTRKNLNCSSFCVSVCGVKFWNNLFMQHKQ